MKIQWHKDRQEILNHFFIGASTSLGPRFSTNDHTSTRDLRLAASFHVTVHTHVKAERGTRRNTTEILPSGVSTERPHISSFRYSLFGNLLPSLAGPTTVGVFHGSYLIALVESHHPSTRRTIETFPLNGKYSLAAPMIILAGDAKNMHDR